ncbi:hypothetical protein LZ012_05585 [Dechloromonas sp. XY25]|uniref:Pilus assembly protein n=1 Tax=Dechloromonas hankyongensis TaxID=2908002 RepID=A0ABS9JZZ2_9RHOO|nr:hypothetical protein [Dechloromonas hankyongensis]MCG2576464.1 hypothetical protein [Dechloromonas hankyongensis]
MNRTTAALCAMAGILALAGCTATTTPKSDARMGEAMLLMRAQQTLNPEASRNAEPVVGLDGKAAKGALDNYRDSFRQPPAETANFLSIGTVGGTR